MKIRFCEHSPKGKSRLVKHLVAEYPGLDVKIKSCCKQCKTCRSTPFCVVDQHQIITAPDWAALHETLRNIL